MTGNPFKPQFSIIDLDKRGKVEVIRVTIQHNSKSVIFLVVVLHHLRIYAIRIYGMHYLGPVHTKTIVNANDNKRIFLSPSTRRRSSCT